MLFTRPSKKSDALAAALCIANWDATILTNKLVLLLMDVYFSSVLLPYNKVILSSVAMQCHLSAA